MFKVELYGRGVDRSPRRAEVAALPKADRQLRVDDDTAAPVTQALPRRQLGLYPVTTRTDFAGFPLPGCRRPFSAHVDITGEEKTKVLWSVRVSSFYELQLPESCIPPRIGERYGEAPYGLKLLFLGESHYRWPNHPEDETTITRVALEGNWDHHRFFLSLEKLIPLPEGQHGLRGWDTVAFYNYVQHFVGNRPRDRPTDEMWSSLLTVSAFSEVLEVCKPDRILIVGKTNWRMMAGKDEVPENPPILEPSFPLPDSFCAGLNPDSERNAYWYSTGAGSWALSRLRPRRGCGRRGYAATGRSRTLLAS
jgi:hypothetical protein